MAEDSLDQLASQLRKYFEFGRRVLKRWLLIGVITAVGIAASVAAALLMTRYYESRTLIAYKETLSQGSIFQEEATHRESNWLSQQLDETFSSHTLRMKVIKDLDLFPKMRDAVAPEVLLDEFSRKVKYDMVGSDSFWISFEYKEPHKAQKVTARLAKEFIDKYVQDKLYAANATLAFMEREVKKARSDMKVIEEQMAQFVSDHPEYQIDPATGLPRGIMQVGASRTPSYAGVTDPELRRALAKKGRLQAQLQLLRNPRSNAQVVQARQEYDRARMRLTALRRKYTDRHPDVQRARAYARQMQMQLSAAMSSQKGGTGKATAVQQEIQTLDQTIARLSRKSRKTHRPKARKPKVSLSKKAQLEMKFYQLTRDREVAKAKYEQLQTQMLRSKVSTNLQRKQTETQFTIVDKANLPGKPVRPSRTKLVLAGTALSFMLGLGLAVLLMLLDPRIYNEDDLRKACDLPLLAQIPKES